MKITVVEDGVRTELELERSVVTIGRALDNDIRLASSQVSRHHCRIETDSEGVWALDLGSSNGTMLRGQRVQRARLESGDLIKIGRATITLDFATARGGETQRLDGAALAALSDVGMATLTGEAQRERENLRIFARLTRELLRETDLGKLLRGIVDGALLLVRAERGFLLLDESLPQVADGAADLELPGQLPLKVRVARSHDSTVAASPARCATLWTPAGLATTNHAVPSCRTEIAGVGSCVCIVGSRLYPTCTPC